MTADLTPSPEAWAIAQTIKRTDHDARAQIALALDCFAAARVEAERQYWQAYINSMPETHKKGGT